jgi:hypothetical protein
MNLSAQLYLTIKSYLNEHYYQVKIDDELSEYHLIRAGVPQGSVLGPILYLIFTADVPLTDNTLMATFADDTAIMSSDQVLYVLHTGELYCNTWYELCINCYWRK